MSRPAPGAPAAARLHSLDAYRGFTMLAMASAGLGLGAVASRNPNWSGIADQFEHRAWEGCTFWDLIQPSFLFIVGVSMVMSYANRQGQGQSWARQTLHAWKRAGLLCLVGMFLDWYGSGQIFIQFIRVLQQIAIGYLIAFAVLPLGPKVQGVTALFLLIGHTAAYLIYGHFHSLANAWTGFEVGPAGYADIAQLNFGQRLDLLLRLPLSTGRYVTFNAISSAATILFGVLVGEMLRCPASHGKKLGVLVGAGAAGLLVGWALSGAHWPRLGDNGSWTPLVTPVVPMVKRIWTASFTIFAAGWTCWMLALFYAVIEGLAFKAWAFPFIVVGMNSIAMYVFAQMFRGTARNVADLIVPPATNDAAILAKRRLCDIVPVVDFSNWNVRFGVDLQNWYLTPLIESVLILTFLWLACYWLYRRQIFFKL
jgi:heparan-alpha-glucosaminide N-acetyltransferase